MNPFGIDQERAFEVFRSEWYTYNSVDMQANEQQWILERAKVLVVPKNEVIYTPYLNQKCVYFICEGLLAKITYKLCPRVKDTSRRFIVSVAPPRHTLLSSFHLYNQSGATKDIVALRKSLIIQIPYNTVLDYYNHNTAFGTLFNVLNNRTMKQIQLLRKLESTNSIQQRYFMFADLMPDLRHILTQQEEADLLDISLNSVKRHSKNYLHRK